MLTKAEINTGRQIEADFAKFICLIGMVIVHCFDSFVSFSETSTNIQYLFLFVLNCIFGAGTFMFCMGLGIAYTSKNTPEKIIKRGIGIFALGYVLNLLCALSYLVLLNDLELFITYLLGPDIMQFAGMALILFGLLKKAHCSDVVIGLIAIGISLIGSLIGTVDLGDPILNIFCGLFFGSFDYEWLTGGIFPLFNWFIFVISGYLFGKYILKRCRNKKLMYLWFSGISAVVISVYMVIAIPNGSGMMGSVLRFHHMHFHEALVAIAGALFALGVYCTLLHIVPDVIQRVIVSVSKTINAVYCCQWVIIAWIVSIWVISGQKQFSDLLIIVIGLVIFTASAVLAQFYSKKIKPFLKNKTEKPKR